MRSCYCPVHQYNTNDSHGIQCLFFDSRYDVPQLLGGMQMVWNLLATATCRANRKVFPYDDLELNKNVQHAEYVCKLDPCIGMVVTRWKDSRVIQTIIIVMVKGTTTVQQWTGREVQSVGIHGYQDDMGAVDKGD
eukprot:9399205-Ditylum_brightwellii.AAC.1